MLRRAELAAEVLDRRTRRSATPFRSAWSADPIEIRTRAEIPRQWLTSVAALAG